MKSARSQIAVEVQDLSKRFEIYAKPSDLLWEALTGRPRHKEFWALRDVSFALRHGEVLGIIGRNGAGKSTLLKILTGTLDKTSGNVDVRGRVSAILELGTGFHPEYSGRKNIVMGGLCLGMTRREVDQKMDWIIDFSELSDFIDQPFKTYSTGMQARLVFSTAICVDPDILIVDEALSVGDVKFQRKCYDQIVAFRNRGKSILLVSHDLNTVSTFCDRAVLLEKGSVLANAEPAYVTKFYHRMLFGQTNETDSDQTTTESQPMVGKQATGDKGGSLDTQRELIRQLAIQKLAVTSQTSHPSEMRYGDRKAEIVDLCIHDASEQPVCVMQPWQRCAFILRAVAHEDLDDLVIAFLVRDPKGVDMFGTDTIIQRIPVTPQKRGNLIEARLDVTMCLAAGQYFLTGSVTRSNGLQYDLRYDAVLFDVTSDGKTYFGSKVNLDAKMSLHDLESVEA